MHLVDARGCGNDAFGLGAGVVVVVAAVNKFQVGGLLASVVTVEDDAGVGLVVRLGLFVPTPFVDLVASLGRSYVPAGHAGPCATGVVGFLVPLPAAHGTCPEARGLEEGASLVVVDGAERGWRECLRLLVGDSLNGRNVHVVGHIVFIAITLHGYFVAVGVIAVGCSQGQQHVAFLASHVHDIAIAMSLGLEDDALIGNAGGFARQDELLKLVLYCFQWVRNTQGVPGMAMM